MKSVYTTLFLDGLKLRKFHGIVKDAATVDGLGELYIFPRYARERKPLRYIHISA